MAASPQWKVYDGMDRYQASCHEIEAAAALMAFYGHGSTIRRGHSKSHIVWTEGRETQPASESYDTVALTAQERLRAKETPRLPGVNERMYRHV